MNLGKGIYDCASGAPTQARKLAIGERLETIKNSLRECANIATGIEQKIEGPQSCCESSEMCKNPIGIEYLINDIEDVLQNVHQTLERVDRKL